jgi:Ca2+-binding RTX toxin-like protein
MSDITKKSLDEAALAQVTGGTGDMRGGSGADSLTGTEGGDKIFGANPDMPHADGSDTILSGGGGDEVHGLAGNDVIALGAGDDKGFGGDGNDVIDGGAGRDEMFGQAGNDSMTGGAGDRTGDYAEGGAGDDTYVWGPGDGSDHFVGGEGRDTLMLQGVSFDQLQAALTQWGSGYSMSYNPATGAVSFLDAHGQPASFSGELNIGGERLMFQQIESIVLAPARC